jgi:hypothetical protein
MHLGEQDPLAGTAPANGPAVSNSPTSLFLAAMSNHPLCNQQQGPNEDVLMRLHQQQQRPSSLQVAVPGAELGPAGPPADFVGGDRGFLEPESVKSSPGSKLSVEGAVTPNK